MTRLTKQQLQGHIGVVQDGVFGPISKAALLKFFTNTHAPALTDCDFKTAADRLGVPVNHIKGVRRVEAPRGAFDDDGRPSILFERHKFRNNSDPPGLYNSVAPSLSGPPYGRGGYGRFSEQYSKLANACYYDPEAAFRACSWGAFQVLGENAVALGYASAFDMAQSLIASEAAHLETFVRFVEKNNAVEKFRLCRHGEPRSCEPFVAIYNGPAYRQFNYHFKLADAI